MVPCKIDSADSRRGGECHVKYVTNDRLIPTVCIRWVKLIPDGLSVILGYSNYSLTLPPALQQALMFGMSIAKMVILKEWKSVSAPCFKKWLNDTVSCLYTLKKFSIFCPRPIPSFLRSGDPLLNILRGRGSNLLGTPPGFQFGLPRPHLLFVPWTLFLTLNLLVDVSVIIRIDITYVKKKKKKRH